MINSHQIFSLIFNEVVANKFKHIGTDRALKIMYLMSLLTKTNISVGCGTAFTIEVLSNNKFVDSYILPGFKAQQDALLNSAEQINNIELDESNSDFYNTETSIYKGILFAYINIIKYVDQLWNPDTIVISGGYAKLIFNSIKVQISKARLIEYHELKIMQQFSKQLMRTS